MSECAKLMVENYAHKNIYNTYNPGRKAFVRIGKKDKNSTKDMKY